MVTQGRIYFAKYGYKNLIIRLLNSFLQIVTC